MKKKTFFRWLAILTLAAVPLYLNYQAIAPLGDNEIMARMAYVQYRKAEMHCILDQGLPRLEGCVFKARYILAGSPGKP